MKPAISIDFDGTLVDHEFPHIGALKPGAKEALEALRHYGFWIIISSCRTSGMHREIFEQVPGQPPTDRKYFKDMVKFLDDNQIPYDQVDDGSLGKVLADFYVDDKAVRFNDNWPQITQFILGKLKPTP